MADIFISYAREDRSRIEPLAKSLEDLGWSVFWDRTIPAGKTWRQVIGDATKNARSVIVAWSKDSIESDWVQEEADIGRRRNILIPVLIDNVDPPLGFGAIQAADLSSWNPAQSSPEFEKLISDISIILGPSPGHVREAEQAAEEELRRKKAEEEAGRARKAEAERKAEEERKRKQEEERRKDDEKRRLKEEQKRAEAEREEKRRKLKKGQKFDHNAQQVRYQGDEAITINCKTRGEILKVEQHRKTVGWLQRMKIIFKGGRRSKEEKQQTSDKRKTEPPKPAEPKPPKPEEPERVEFATFAPRIITQNCSFILDVWAYLPHQYSSITSKAQELGRDVNVGRKTGVPVQKGSILSITIDIENLIVPDPIDTLVWESEPTNASFIIKVPDDAAIGKYPGRAIISHQGIAIAKIVFLISVDAVEGKEYTDHSAETVYPKTAFASYASENRDEVLSRIQGMKKVAPDLDIFLDVFSLRSGQNWQEKLEQHVPTKDTFYLFWSVPASRSEWVEREWKLALSRRGLMYIDPVPLEEPDIVPPPQELSALHFSDAYLAYIKYQQIKKNAQIRKES